MKEAGSWAWLLGYEAEWVVTEFAWQLDLSIFDGKVSHARTGSHIERATGHAPQFENVCHAHFGKDVRMIVVADLVAACPSSTRSVGRPRNPRAKRLRYDAWNAYVAENTTKDGLQ